MRSYERNGLMVDQCSGCQGIFLDRGELERLVDAESAYYERFPAGRERHHHDDDHDRYERRRHESGGLSELGGLGGLLGSARGHGGHGGHYGHHGYKRKKHKRESFLSELFD